MADAGLRARELIGLSDYRARTAELYADVRAHHASDPAAARRQWVADRAALLDSHSQSPVTQGQLDYWDYDPDWCFRVDISPTTGIEPLEILEGDGATPRRFVGIGSVSIAVPRATTTTQLPVYWSDSYGGGFFVPFGDATNGAETFGSGRYVLDGAKGADLGRTQEQLVIDFNFAYHPSCVWGDWVCPLPSKASQLGTAVHAGERKANAGGQRHGHHCERTGCGAFVPDGAVHDCC